MLWTKFHHTTQTQTHPFGEMSLKRSCRACVLLCELRDGSSTFLRGHICGTSVWHATSSRKPRTKLIDRVTHRWATLDAIIYMMGSREPRAPISRTTTASPNGRPHFSATLSGARLNRLQRRRQQYATCDVSPATRMTILRSGSAQPIDRPEKRRH